MFTSKRAVAEDLAELRTKYDAIRQQIKTVEHERDAARWEIRHLASSQADLVITRTRERDTAVRALRDTENQLAAARGRPTAADVQFQYDIHHQALTRALNAEPGRNWDQLIADARQVREATDAVAGENRDLKKQVTAAEQARRAFVDQITELRRCNDDLSRQAVDRAGYLARTEGTR